MKIKIPEKIPETENMGGWTRVSEDAVRVYQKMLRLQKSENAKESYPYKIRGSLLINMTDESSAGHWTKIPLATIEELIHIHMQKNIRYANCKKTPYFYMKTTHHTISVWPRYETDYTATNENNWGEEE